MAQRRTCLLQPLSDTRLEAEPVQLEEAMWQHEVGCWRPESVKWKVRRHRGGPRNRPRGGKPLEALQRQASGGASEAHLAAHLCAT